MATDLQAYFRVEAAEILEGLEKGALALERGAVPAEVTPSLLRLAHTLKGAARVVRHARLAELSHEVEDALAPLRERMTAPEPERIRALLGLLDAMTREVGALAGAMAPTAPAADPPTASNEDAFRTVRADLAEMDALIEGLSEVEVRLGAFRASRRALAHARRLTERLARVVVDEALHATVAELDAALGGVEQLSDEALGRVERELREVRDGAERLRLVQASAAFAALDRAVRDAGELVRKQVRFHAEGGDVRLDASVLGILQPALVQLVRNAVAHGIEAEPARIAARKPVAGSIEVKVARRGRRVAFTCSDDGAGIDWEAVRRAARARGGAPVDEAQDLDVESLVRLLTRGGITTSSTLSQAAGRGVGLDIVRNAVARVRGELSVRTEKGRGTSFEISVPISVASVEVLLVEVDAFEVAVPIEAVRRSLRVQPADLAHTAEGSTVLHAGEAMPFVPLAALLGGSLEPRYASRGSEASTAIVIEAGDGRVALAADRLLGTAHVMLRALPPLAHATPIVAAASLDGEGDPRLVLDPEALVAAARRARPGPLRPAARRPPVLVIDDSLTTRMLEQTILESAGYEVDVASSGEEGLAKARHRAYGLFLVDVEMPGMDGFAFVAETRAQPELRGTPAILVTSRGAPEDRQRGMDCGAGAYVVKGEFDQTELLHTIRRLMQEAR